jgi:hypothetical protein
MGTGGTVAVSDQQVQQWLEGEVARMRGLAAAALGGQRTALLKGDAFTLADGEFTHVAHVGDFNITVVLAAEISNISDAVFHNGQHRTVVVPRPVVPAEVARIGIPVNPGAPPPGTPPSASVRAVAEACSLFGDLLNTWSASVAKYVAQPGTPTEIEQHAGSDLGAGFNLAAFQHIRGTPGVDTPVTGKYYIETAYAFLLVYSHAAFLRYEAALDAAFIAKLKKEMEDKLAAASAANRSMVLKGDNTQADLNNAVGQYWRLALRNVAEAERRAGLSA